MFDLQLFGPMQVRGKRLALSSSAKLLAQLARRPDRVWSRPELGNTVWPDADETSARNRIRTALTEIRRVLPDPEALSGDKHSLSLASAHLTCDLWHAQTLQRRIRTATDHESELALNRSLVDLIAPGFLPEFADGWVVAERAQWSAVLGECCVRIVELEPDPAATLSVLGRWIQQDPFSEKGWECYLSVAARVGRGAAVAGEFDAMRARMRSETGGKPSRGLLALADSVRKSLFQTPGLSPIEAELVRNTFDRMRQSHPAEAAAFLGSRSFRPEVFRDPVGTAKLLMDALETGIGTHDDLMNCRVHVLISSGQRFDHDLTIRIAKEIIEFDHDPIRLRGAHSALSFAHLKLLEWERADAHARRSLEIAEEIGEEVGIAIAKAQVGNLCLVQSDTKEAIRRFEDMLAILERHDTLSANNGRATGLCNLANALFYDGQIESALATLRRGLLACDETNQPMVKEQHLAQLGFILITEKQDLEQGVDAFIKGIAQLMRFGEPHLNVGCIEGLACVLASLGYRAQALAAFGFSADMRENTDNPATPLDQAQRDKFMALCEGVVPDPEWEGFTTAQRYARRGIRILQNHVEQLSVQGSGDTVQLT